MDFGKKYTFVSDAETKDKQFLAFFSDEIPSFLRSPAVGSDGQSSGTVMAYAQRSDPRKMHQRMIVANPSDLPLSYVGRNFDSVGGHSNLCKYAVGLVDRKKRRIELMEVSHVFDMKASLVGTSQERKEERPSSVTEGAADVVEQKRTLIEAFGGKRSKTQTIARELGAVNEEDLSAGRGAMEGKEEVAKEEPPLDRQPWMPPCHAEAREPSGVYLREELISQDEWDSLDVKKVFDVVKSPEKLEEMSENTPFKFVMNHLEQWEKWPKGRENEVAGLLMYITYLLRLRPLPMKTVNRTDVVQEALGCSELVADALCQRFFVEGYDGRFKKNVLKKTRESSDKLVMWTLALCLIVRYSVVSFEVEGFEIEPSLIAGDLGFSVTWTVTCYKALGCTARTTEKKTQDTAAKRLVTLRAPPKFPEPQKRARKRKLPF